MAAPERSSDWTSVDVHNDRRTDDFEHRVMRCTRKDQPSTISSTSLSPFGSNSNDCSTAGAASKPSTRAALGLRGLVSSPFGLSLRFCPAACLPSDM